MNNELTLDDFKVILESLKYSKQRIEDYRDHPSYEFKRQQVERVAKVMEKVKVICRAM